MKTLTELSNTEFNLTTGEQTFLQTFIEANGCGAETPEALFDDNFSCQCLDDLDEVYPNLTRNQIGGFLSSLQEKQVLTFEKRHGPRATTKNMWTFEPDLYWVNDAYLVSLPQDLIFEMEGN